MRMLLGALLYVCACYAFAARSLSPTFIPYCCPALSPQFLLAPFTHSLYGVWRCVYRLYEFKVRFRSCWRVRGLRKQCSRWCMYVVGMIFRIWVGHFRLSQAMVIEVLSRRARHCRRSALRSLCSEYVWKAFSSMMGTDCWSCSSAATPKSLKSVEEDSALVALTIGH
jgi:hypothetical protein